jgi:rod shape-determining protein MreD
VIRRSVAISVLLLTVVLVQVSLLPLLLRSGFVPDLVVVLVVLVTLEEGAGVGLRVAAAGGLLLDLLASSVPLGSTMLVLGTIAYGMALLRPYLSERAELATALLCGVAAGVSVLFAGGLQTLLTEQGAPSTALLSSGTLVVSATGVLLAPVLAPLVRRSLGDAPQDRAVDMPA